MMKRNKTDIKIFTLVLISFLIALAFLIVLTFADSQGIEIEDLDIDGGSSMSPTGAMSGTIG